MAGLTDGIGSGRLAQLTHLKAPFCWHNQQGLLKNCTSCCAGAGGGGGGGRQGRHRPQARAGPGAVHVTWCKDVALHACQGQEPVRMAASIPQMQHGT